MSLSLTVGILKKYQNIAFVETGTYHGGGIDIALSAGFKDIRSIEVYLPFQEENIKRFSKYPNVHLYVGDSETMLWDMIKDINEPITFFLDSHVVQQTSEEPTVAKVEVPLLQELKIINKHHIKTHTILIDDVRMMGYKNITGGWISNEWKNIPLNSVLKELFKINKNYLIRFEDTVNGKGDLLVANPNIQTISK